MNDDGRIGAASAAKVWLIGQQHDSDAHNLREFLSRNRVPFQWVDVDTDAVLRFGASDRTPAAKYPVCLFPDGTRLESPSHRELAARVGLRTRPSQSTYDLAIFGAGPAGTPSSVSWTRLSFRTENQTVSSWSGA